MSRIELIAPCHFGLESVLKKEILDLGYEIVQVEDGRITFAGEEDAVARANMFIRTAERIMIKCGSFKAVTFDELFEGTKIASDPDYKKYMNKYNVIHLDISSFWDDYKENIIEKIVEYIYGDLQEAFGDFGGSSRNLKKRRCFCYDCFFRTDI